MNSCEGLHKFKKPKSCFASYYRMFCRSKVLEPPLSSAAKVWSPTPSRPPSGSRRWRSSNRRPGVGGFSTSRCPSFLITWVLYLNHRDRSYIERACSLQDVKMTWHGLQHRGWTSAECLYIKNIDDLIKKQPNLPCTLIHVHALAC